MSRFPKPLPIVVYQDVLSAWCYVAESRLRALREEFGELLRWSARPFPMRVHEAQPTQREIDVLVKELRRAQREPEGSLLRPELWTTGDAPRSSVPALAALEAAKLQGPQAVAQLMAAMKRTALEQGVNVTRTDVVLELASRVGLDMNRFVAAFQSPETTRLILEEHRLASERGVRGVPTVVIGGRWMISGLRALPEWRRHLLECLGKSGLSGLGSPDRMVH